MTIHQLLRYPDACLPPAETLAPVQSWPFYDKQVVPLGES